MKPESDFGTFVAKSGNRLVKSQCRKCDVDIAAAYRKTPAGKAARKVEGKRKLAFLKRVFRAFKESQTCCYCLERSPVCLDYHHLKGNDKRSNQIAFGFNKWNLKKLVEEISKCVCLCANCHRKFHAGLIKLPAGIKPISKKLLIEIINRIRHEKYKHIADA